MSCRVAIVGGGPGGLMTAYCLQKACSVPVDVTIYEASGRLGGKIRTGSFASAAVSYEAGAAELYDYSHLGEDPLRDLVDVLGLRATPMHGSALMLSDELLRDMDDVSRVHGEATHTALMEFDARARAWMSPEEYYESDWGEPQADPMATRTFEQELALVPDAAAQHYLRCMVHSDLATEPHKTSAAYGLQNYLMNDPGYMRLYTLRGGIETLPKELAARLDAEFRLQERVVRVARTAAGRLRVSSRATDGRTETHEAIEEHDFVVAALPNNLLPAIEWEGDVLGAAMQRHYVHFDYPAHYLRVSILFREPFWRHVFQESYCMLDAFGGCCLYDESARNGCESHGVLGWLLAGDAALTAGNAADEEILRMALDSLPLSLQHGKRLFVEGRVHRWNGAVNGWPGGRKVLSLERRHSPEPSDGNLFVVGDYLFDSTLNGVLDSASYVAEALAERIHSLEAADQMVGKAGR